MKNNFQVGDLLVYDSPPATDIVTIKGIGLNFKNDTEYLIEHHYIDKKTGKDHIITYRDTKSRIDFMINRDKYKYFPVVK